MHPIRLSEYIRFVEIRIKKRNHLVVMRLSGNSYALLSGLGRYGAILIGCFPERVPVGAVQPFVRSLLVVLLVFLLRPHSWSLAGGLQFNRCRWGLAEEDGPSAELKNKPYVSRKCSKGFTQSADLTRHLQTHER